MLLYCQQAGITTSAGGYLGTIIDNDKHDGCEVMIKHILNLMLVSAVLLGGTLGNALAADKEPARHYTLTVDGNKHPIAIGEKKKLRLGDKNVKMMLSVDPYREFDKHGVSFIFPENYVYSHDDSDDTVKIWSLDGADNIVMLQKYDLATSPEVLLEAFLPEYKQQFQGLKVKEKKKTFSTKRNKLRGHSLEIRMGDIGLIQDIYAFKNAGGLFILIVQDTRENPSKATTEYKAMLKLLRNSLKI